MGEAASFQLGIDLGHQPSNAQAEAASEGNSRTRDPGEANDYFVRRNGVTCAGIHLIIDLWGAKKLDDEATVQRALRAAVEAAGATLLHLHLHRFNPSGGLSGVAVLEESHISIHTWPERNFAALDIFMCGDTDPHRAIPVLERAFHPERVTVGEHLRGRIE